MKKLNKQAIVHQTEKSLKRVEKYLKIGNMSNEDCRIESILIKEKTPDLKTIKAFAYNYDYVIEFSPYRGDDDIAAYPIYALGYNLTLDKLEKGYNIIDIPFDEHQYFWEEISDSRYPDVFPNAVQKYLKYCKQHGITKAKLQEQADYTGEDIMKYYQKEKHHSEPER